MNASRLIGRTNTGLVKRRPGKWSLKRYVGVRRQDAECGAGKGLLSEGLARLIGTSDRMRMAQEQLLSRWGCSHSHRDSGSVLSDL